MAVKSFGRVEVLPSGRVRARYPDPTPGSTKRIAAPTTFATKTAARQWLARVQASIADGSWVHPDEVAARAEAEAAETARKSVTFAEYADRWIDRRTAAGKLGEAQAVEYRRLRRGPLPKAKGQAARPAARLHWVADRPINAVTRTEVQQWHDESLAACAKANGRGLTALSRAYEHLATVFAAAVEDELIDRSPCRVADAKTETGRKRLPPTDDELATVIEAMPERLRSLTVAAAAMGGRFGELTALRASDVEVVRDDEGAVDAVRIDVSKAVRYVPGKGRVEKGTKTGDDGAGTVSVFGDDALILAAHIEGMKPDQLLWTDSTGQKPLPHKTFSDHWHKARLVAGRPDLELHSLRHYHGSRFAQLSGASMAEVMARLRHKSVAAAMRYQHAGSRADELARRAAR